MIKSYFYMLTEHSTRAKKKNDEIFLDLLSIFMFHLSRSVVVHVMSDREHCRRSNQPGELAMTDASPVPPVQQHLTPTH